MENIKILVIALVALLIFAGIMLATSSKTTLVIDGKNNGTYAEAINNVYNHGLEKVSNETARLANVYIDDCNPSQIVLINPTVQNIKDFYGLCNYHNIRLIIGSTPNEVELKSQLFESGLNNKEIRFQTNQDWAPDNYKNIGKGYTY